MTPCYLTLYSDSLLLNPNILSRVTIQFVTEMDEISLFVNLLLNAFQDIVFITLA